MVLAAVFQSLLNKLQKDFPEVVFFDIFWTFLKIIQFRLKKQWVKLRTRTEHVLNMTANYTTLLTLDAHFAHINYTKLL